MATVTGLTAARMLEIEQASVVAGTVDPSGNLTLTTHGGSTIAAGNIKGPKGDSGDSSAAPPGVALKGGNISAWQTNPTEGINKILADIDQLRLDTVTLPVWVRATNIWDDKPYLDLNHLAFAKQVEMALPSHVKIIIEPYPWLDDGNMSETEWAPTNLDTWFNYWEAACVLLAKEFPHAWGCYLASNIPQLVAANSTRWGQLIAAVREETTANMILRVNWWRTASWAPELLDTHIALVNSPFWAHVDIIALSAYFELTESLEPSLDHLKSTLISTDIYERSQHVFKECMMFTERWGKPWFFGELAVSKWTNGASAPWNPNPGTTLSRTLQARFFRAYVETFAGKQNWLGFSIFNIGHPYNDGGYLLERAATQYISTIPSLSVTLPPTTGAYGTGSNKV